MKTPLFRPLCLILALALPGLAPAEAKSPPASDTADLAVHCAAAPEGREGWTTPAPPRRIHGNTFYVGTCGITALLVTAGKGHILIDGGPAEAAPLVAANIAKLGFKLRDVRWIVTSHEHWDHVGALAELKRRTGAKVAALTLAAEALRTGKALPDDPQRGAEAFAPVKIDRILRDGEELALGKLRLTVRATPAHAPGSASWTWRSCATLDCRTIAYADSATLISDDSYRFADHPERIAAARDGLARIKALPCDILVTPHPGASDLFERLSGQAPLVDPQACRHYAEGGEARFAQRLADEAKGPAR